MAVSSWRNLCATVCSGIESGIAAAFRLQLTRKGAVRTWQWMVLLTVLVVGMAQAATYVYDSNGRLRAVINSTGASGRYVYDAMGNLLRIDNLSATQLAIFTFSPGHGSSGTPVVISGQNFGTTPASNTVTFNGVAATVTAASVTQITATVPSGASTGPIAVTTATGTATSDDMFVVDDTGLAPAITSFTPGLATVGTNITVVGTHMDPVPNQTTVSINGTYIPATSITDTKVVFAVPAYVGSGYVSITTPYGQANSTNRLYIAPPGISIAAGSVPVRQALGVGAKAAITIPSGTYAAITFSNTTNKWLTFQISGITTTASGISYYVYDQNNRVITNTGLAGGANSSIHLPAIPPSGTYSLWITPYGGPATMTVFLEADQVLASGTPLTIATAAPGETERVTFLADVGQTAALFSTNVTVTPSSNQAEYTVLAPANLGDVGSAGSNYAAPALIPPLNVPIASAGTYQVIVSAQLPATASLQMELILGTVYPLVVNGPTVSVPTTTAGQYVYMDFAALPNDNLSLALDGGSMSLVEVYDATNNLVAGANCYLGCTDLHMQNLAGGNYQVIVTPYYTQGNANYPSTITLATTLSRDIVGGTLQPNGSLQTVSLARPGQYTVFTFAGSVGQFPEFQTSNVTPGSGAAINVYNPGGALIYGPILERLAQAGTYTVDVVTNLATTPAASLSLAMTSAANSNLTINAGSQPFTTPAQQPYYFIFTPPAGANLNVDVTAINSAASLEVYDANDNVVGFSSSCQGVLPASCSVRIAGASGGSYWAAVTETVGSGQLSFTAAVLQDVTGLLSSTPMQLNLLNGQFAALTFAGTNETTVVVSGTASGTSANYYVYAPDNSYVASLNTSQALQWTLPTLTQTGTYQFLVQAPSGALSQQLSETAH